MKYGVKTATTDPGTGPTGTGGGVVLLALGGTPGGVGSVQAETFRLANPNDGVIGAPFYVKTRREDTPAGHRAPQ